MFRSTYVACEANADESTVKKTLPRNGLNFRCDLLRSENIFFQLRGKVIRLIKAIIANSRNRHALVISMTIHRVASLILALSARDRRTIQESKLIIPDTMRDVVWVTATYREYDTSHLLLERNCRTDVERGGI